MSLSMWCVYAKPSDFPDHYVARRFEIDKPTSEFLIGRTLDDVRKQLPPGLFCLDRHPDDDAPIVEVWF